MKRSLFILSFLLACLFCNNPLNFADNASHTNALSTENATCSSVGYTACGSRTFGLNLQGILSTSASGYSEESNSFSPSVRSTSNGRRVQSSSRTSLRIARSGKLIDTRNIVTFQSNLELFSSGIRSNARYIHSICILRI